MPRRKRRSWGTGSIAKRGDRWWIFWRENGRRKAKSYPTEAVAREVLATVVAEVARGGAGLPTDYSGSPTLEELAVKWLARRERTHRSAADDRSRWKVHLAPVFGKLKPHEVDAGKIRIFIENRLATKLSPTTVGHCIRLLSTFFCDVVEQGYAPSNPVATLPRSSRRLYRSDYDTRNTPFLQTTNDVRRVFLALAEPYNIAFACGALAGLRTGEVLGLSWKDIDIAGRRIHVRQQMQDGRLCGLKDDEGRIVPLQTSLAPILAEWKLKTGGEGLLFKPAHGGGGGRPELGSEPMFIRPQTIHAALAKALKACGLPTMTWYQCTRHSYASLWVLAGHSIERLSKIMGHASVTTTEHYAHLKPDLFPEKDFDAITVDLSKPAGDVVSLPHSRPLGNTMTTEREDIAEQQIA